jgi:hypothetical protein
MKSNKDLLEWAGEALAVALYARYHVVRTELPFCKSGGHTSSVEVMRKGVTRTVVRQTD